MKVLPVNSIIAITGAAAVEMEMAALRNELSTLRTQLKEKERHCIFMGEIYQEATEQIEFLKKQVKNSR